MKRFAGTDIRENAGINNMSTELGVGKTLRKSRGTCLKHSRIERNNFSGRAGTCDEHQLKHSTAHCKRVSLQ